MKSIKRDFIIVFLLTLSQVRGWHSLYLSLYVYIYLYVYHTNNQNNHVGFYVTKHLKKFMQQVSD